MIKFHFRLILTRSFFGSFIKVDFLIFVVELLTVVGTLIFAPGNFGNFLKGLLVNFVDALVIKNVSCIGT